MTDEYDPADDARRSYEAAVEAKRLRGDTHWPERAPWKRKEIIGDCTLYLGDCLPIMRQLPNVAAVLTDPPYGEGYAAKPVRGNHESKEWDNSRPDRKTFEEILKIAPQQIIWGGNYFADMLPARMRWLMWDKIQRGFSLADFELAWTSQNKCARAFEYSRARAAQDGEKQHPTRKPVELMVWCLGFLPEGVVLDPFMGSGTTGVACIKQGRPFIGIEIDEGYFNIACERIRKAYAQPDFFVSAPAPQPVQQPLFGEAAE